MFGLYEGSERILKPTSIQDACDDASMAFGSFHGSLTEQIVIPASYGRLMGKRMMIRGNWGVRNFPDKPILRVVGVPSGVKFA